MAIKNKKLVRDIIKMSSKIELFVEIMNPKLVIQMGK